MSGPDLQKMLEQAQSMQTRMAELQEELGRRKIEASAGGGMVTAVVTGQLRVHEIRIEPALFEDPAMLQDLTAAAVNAALQKAQVMIQEEMQRAAGGLGGLLGGPGGPTGA